MRGNGLRSTTKGNNAMLRNVIDQAALAAKNGITLRRSTLLEFGNPALGTQFVTGNPDAGLDWPVRLLVGSITSTLKPAP